MVKAVKTDKSKSKSKKSSSSKVSQEENSSKKPELPILYENLDVQLFRMVEGLEPLYAENAKEIIGWEEEPEGETWTEYTLKDINGKKIRLNNNLTNRYFTYSVAKDWMLEILRRKWKLNGETMIIDRTGMVQDGQHRLCGLILAEQTWKNDKEQWLDFWPSEPYIETFVVLGIMEDDDTINTIGVGKPRTLAEVVFRSEMFYDLSMSQRKQCSKILAFAMKLLWRRTHAKEGTSIATGMGAYAPKRSHSESLDFINRHIKMLECVKVVYEMDAQRGLIGKYYPPGYAAGILYLMASGTSDREKYIVNSCEESLNWSLWDKAIDFWERLAEGVSGMKPLADALLKIDSSGSLGLDEKTATVIKAWHLFSDGRKLSPEKLEVRITQNEFDQLVLAENPLCGGIDMGPVFEPVDLEE